MTYLKKGWKHVIEWTLCCPMEDREQFSANLEELRTVVLPYLVAGTAVGTVLVLFFSQFPL